MNDYRQVDDTDTLKANCNRCGIVIDYAYVTTGEVVCEKCYYKAIEKRSDELKNKI